jgi:tetratricopeptide (TPR) repeat protein
MKMLYALRLWKDSAMKNKKPMVLTPKQIEINQYAATLHQSGQLNEAVEQFKKLLKQQPNNTTILAKLSTIAFQQRKYEDGIKIINKSLQIDPNQAIALYNRGKAFQELNRLDDALASYDLAIALNPNIVEANYNRGVVLQALKRTDDALASYDKAIALNPNYFEAYYNRGVALQDINRSEDALASYNRAIALNPNHAVIYFSCGIVLQKLNRLNDAVACYERAIFLNPDYAEAYYNCGGVLYELKRLDDAIASYDRAIALKPDYAEAYNNRSATLLELGRLDEAEASVRQALEIKPDYIQALFNLTHLKKGIGDQENLSALAVIKDTVFNDSKPPSNDQAVLLYFSLGRSYDDAGEYDKAFPYFFEGCKLQRTTFDYDAEQMTKYFASIKQTFNHATMDKLRGKGDISSLPIFVIGMPRSGTTLIEQIISSHPEVHGAGEFIDIMPFTQLDTAIAISAENLLRLGQEQLSAKGADYIARLQMLAPEARRITDKTTTNFFAVGLIHLMLPNAKIIHVNRNPLDTCLSCFTTLFKNGNRHTYDLEELGRYYLDYARLMGHWRKLLPSNVFLDVYYEDIVANQQVQSLSILEFCGLEWSNACLDFHKNNRQVSTASKVQVRRPIYQSSVNRWRSYQKFLTPLLDALAELSPYGYPEHFIKSELS